MKNKLLTASAVLFVAFLAGQVTRFVGNVVLANLLSPGAFGVVAVVNLMILALNLLSDVGLRQIVIQRQGEITASFTNTVWALQVARGFLIWSVAILCGLVLRLLQLYGWIGVSASYSDPLLPFLIAAAGSAALFQGFESTKALTERRALALGRVTAIGLIAQVFAMVLMITVAKLSPSPWALVIGGVASAGLQCVLTHLWLPGSPSKCCTRESGCSSHRSSPSWAAMPTS